MFSQLEEGKIQFGPQKLVPIKISLPISRRGDQVSTRMRTCRTFDCKRSRGESIESTRNVASTPTTDLPEVDPYTEHQGEFIITVLEKGYQ